jgi:glycerol kinase
VAGADLLRVTTAGLATGVWSDLAALEATWASDRRFDPKMDADLRTGLVAGWQKAVERALL